MRKLVIHPEVKSLFKYCPIGINQLSALAQKKIWYSKPAEFNDPFDTKFNVRGIKYLFEQGMNYQNKSAFFDNDISDTMVFKKKYFDDILDSFKKGVEDLGILSLASSNKNLLMWSHYASEHKGMCLEFARTPNTVLADNKKLSLCVTLITIRQYKRSQF